MVDVGTRKATSQPFRGREEGGEKGGVQDVKKSTEYRVPECRHGRQCIKETDSRAFWIELTFGLLPFAFCLCTCGVWVRARANF